MVSAKTVLSYSYWKIPFTVHTDASDKQLGAVISQNNKSIAFFPRIFIKPQFNYTMTEKELISIVGCLKQLHRILFGYEVNVFSYHKNMVYAATLSESQRAIHWRLILKEFGPNIYNISVVDNIVADTISRFSFTSINKYNSCTRKIQCCDNKLFVLSRVENNKYCFPIDLLIVQREQQ